MTPKPLSLAFLILAIGCFAVLVFFILYLFLAEDAFTLPTVIGGLIIGIVGISAFIGSRSYAHQKRLDDKKKESELP